MKKYLLFPLALTFLLICSALVANGGEHIHASDNHHQATGSLKFLQNKTQWEPEVRYRADLRGGQVFLLDRAFVFCYQHAGDFQDLMEMYHDPDPAKHREADQRKIRQHAYRVHFENAEAPRFAGNGKAEAYYNFFIGNDPSRWSNRVPAFDAVQYQGLYPGIGMKVYSSEGNFKYDFLVEAGADPGQIMLRYEALEGMQLRDGNLLLQTSVNEIVEQKPFAYQLIAGQKVEVRCAYILQGDRVRFDFPDGFDPSHELVIDPVVVASTFSGSTSTIFGHSATFDLAGNVYSAGGGFGPGGLPITTGAFQATYGGGRDYTISKFNPDGSSLIFATYIGGSNGDLPHSMVTNSQGDLYIFGSTFSSNYPTSPTAYQPTSGGQRDIGLTKLDPTGTVLLGSTYLGGSDIDGENIILVNYGDTYKGEVVVDAQDNVYLASNSRSPNFPTTPGALQNTLSGMQDGVLVKLNSNLSTLIYSTYFGGPGNDALFGLVPDSSGGAYVTGSAASQFFTPPPGAAYPTFQGGSHDGFIAHFNNTASTVLKATYFGSSATDHSFFLELDRDGDVYIFGQSSTVAATPGVYAGPGSGMYIAKFDDTLGVHQFTSTFSHVAPTAFLVDNCGYIYTAGHGSTGFKDLSPNALQTVGGFYLLVLEPNATAINHATFFGASGSHVDGGTSRFDKRGFVYEATCTAGTFPTLPNAYAPNNLSPSWDVSVFKIDFQVNTIVAQASVSPSTIGCAPWTVNFINTSVGQSFQWDFGDGSPVDTAFQPAHTYLNPGTYTVQLVVYDSTACIPYDTAYLQLQVTPGTGLVSSFSDSLDCPSQTVFLTNTGSSNVGNIWDMGDGNTYTNLQSFSHTYASPGTYTITLVLNDTLCNNQDTSFATVVIGGTVVATANAIGNTIGCAPHTVTFGNASNGTILLWDFGDGSPTVAQASPTHTFVNPGTYTVTHYSIDSSTCNIIDSATISITALPQPVAVVPPDFSVCPGDVAQLNASGGSSYLWQPAAGLLPNNAVSNPTVTLNATTTFTVIVTGTGGCADTASITVNVNPLSIDAGPDASFCIGSGGTQLNAIGPVGGIAPFTYQWSCNAGPGACAIDSVNDNDPLVSPSANTLYYLLVTDSLGCTALDSVLVSVYTVPVPGGYRDTTLCDNATLLLAPSAPTSASFLWQDNSTAPTYNVTGPGLYWVQVSNVCDTIRDSVQVYYEPFPTVDLGNDTTICPQDTLLLLPTVTGANGYLWTGGTNDPFYEVTQPGLVTLVVSSPNCGTASDQIRIDEHPLPVSDLGPDRMLCEGIPLMLHTREYPGASYLWQDGITDPSRPADQSGTYSVIVSLLCGDAMDTVEVFFQPLPQPDLGLDTLICPGDTAFLTPGVFASYEWQDGFTGPVYPVTEPGTYQVWITDSVGCKANDRASVGACIPELFIPTAFSPNGDGLNEVWFPVEYLVRVDDIRVYDRWGKLVFASQSAQDGWDGSFLGDPVQEGAYAFVVGYVFPGGGRGTRAGTVTLLR